MSTPIYIGNFAKGLTTNRLPFNIDNDAFPTMVNMYSWRGRAKRKRGTTLLGQLQLQVQSVLNSAPPLAWQTGQFTLTSDATNLLTTTITNITKANPAVVTHTGTIFQVGQSVTISGVVGMTQVNGNTYTIVSQNATTFTLNLDSSGFTTYTSGGIASPVVATSVVPGSISVTVGGQLYKEPTQPDGTLIGNATPAGTGTINYATGAVTITGGGAGTMTGTWSYYPDLPVLGLEDYQRPVPPNDTSGLFIYPVLIAFDSTKAYQYQQDTTPYYFYNTSFYKSTNNPVSWSGQDYQLFWSNNYSGAFWATNNNPGFHFKTLANVTNVSITRVTSTQVSITITTPSNLVANDLLWFNEVTGTIATGSGATANQNINGQTGIVASVSSGSPNDTIVVNFNGTGGSTLANFQAAATGAGGIVQLLTSSISGQDGIRWYDGDMTGATGLPTSNSTGWVNFAPPLSATGQTIDNISSTSPFYLVGALAIVPFKDRLIFFSPWIQTSTGNALNLRDTALWSWNGTPYYNLSPSGETRDPTAYYVDQTGKGGYLTAGTSESIVTVNNNQDVLLVGFTGRQTRFVYTGNDLFPFLFYSINSELGSSATFSGVTLDVGGLTFGTYGLAMTTQQSSQRIDLDIPDQVFSIQKLNNGPLRVNAIRDYYREWIYFSYPAASSLWKFPTQTLMYNYRDNTWAIMLENSTVHGRIFKQKSTTWAQLSYQTWSQWQEPWSSGTIQALFPSVISGNAQGFVLVLDEETDEDPSGTIISIANSGGETQITSPNNCLAAGDYIYISGCLGSTDLNGQIGIVSTVSTSAGTFLVDIPFPSGTYGGLGQFTRLSQPNLLSKQFNFFWEQGRQARLGNQKYLLNRTTSGQVTLNIYLSQNDTISWNDGPIVPQDSPNNSLIYSQILYTCPENSAIGLTPSNTNLQMPTADSQYQIWHRVNTSLIGDTFQVGITLSDAQMRNLVYATSEIDLHGIILTVSPSSLLA